MNKKELIEVIVGKLEEELAVALRAVEVSKSEALENESKSEDECDTASLEASFLAAGQNMRAEGLQKQIDVFKGLKLIDFTDKTPITNTALVELVSGKQTSYYFIAPSSGGLKVTYQNKNVMVITLASPLGKDLMGKVVGDDFEVETPQSSKEYVVQKVW